jgi:hypothetical protein
MRRLSVLLACVVMAITLIAAASGVSAAPKQQPPPDHFYGVLYFSNTQGASYWDTGSSKASANQAAYNFCQQVANDCEPSLWVYNGWAAVVLGETQGGKTWLGAAYGRTEQEVVNNALTGCQEAGLSGCTPAGTAETAFDPIQDTTGGFNLPKPRP